MRIHYLSASQIPSRAANSVHVMKMCEAMARAGHDVVLFGTEGEDARDDAFDRYGVEACFRLVRIPRTRVRGLGALKLAADVRRAVLGLGLPDLFYGRYLYSLVAVASLGVPFAFESHAPPLGRLRRAAERWLFRRAGFRALVVISEALRDEYRRLVPELPEGRIVVAHDGATPADPASIPPPDAPAEEGRGLQVGYVGHLYRGRGMDVIAALAARLPDYDFHVVGGAEADLADARRRFDADNLHFHGFVAHALLPSYFARFDVVLAPYQHAVAVAGGGGDTSRWMSPLKIFEYMAAGLPMVVSDLPVLREVLADGRNALLVPPDDVGAWEGALRFLNANPDARRSLASAALEDLLATYTWERRAGRLLAGLA